MAIDVAPLSNTAPLWPVRSAREDLRADAADRRAAISEQSAAVQLQPDNAVAAAQEDLAAQLQQSPQADTRAAPLAQPQQTNAQPIETEQAFQAYQEQRLLEAQEQADEEAASERLEMRQAVESYQPASSVPSYVVDFTG